MTPGSIAGMIERMNDLEKARPAVHYPDRDPALPPYAPSYDEKELEAFIEKDTKAWADVPDSVAWVREIRGHDRQ